MIFIFFISGVIFWTLTEYLLHRFLGHVHKGKNFFKTEHVMHHSKANYFAPAYKKVIMGLIVFVFSLVVISFFINVYIVLTFLIGFFGMYMVYEITHSRFHSKKPLIMPFLILRKHHFFHHFHNPKMNHGVTTRFWDRVFGTYSTTDKVKVPSKMPLEWLMIGTEINPKYSLHFSCK